LFDEVVAGDALEAAIAFARKIVAEKVPSKHIRDLRIDYPNAEGFFAFARNTVATVAKKFPRAVEMRRCRGGRGIQAGRRGSAL